jgi:hypothetical protein
MRRTNIYLTDEQCSILDVLARSSGTSRAELIRQLLDQAISGEKSDLSDDLQAIRESFGALSGEELEFDRKQDERARHLDRLARS